MMMKRVNQFVKAYVNEGLEKLEDPVIMVKQYMRDMQEAIHKSVEQIKKQEALSLTLKSNLDLTDEQIHRRDQQAKIAVENDNDLLAKKIISNKNEAIAQKIRYKELLQRNEEQLKVKKVELDQLQQKYNRLKDRKLELVMRLEAIKSVQKLEKQTISNGSLMKTTVESEFDRWEDMVNDLEGKWGKSADPEKELQVDEKVEEELTRLKEELKKAN